MPLIASVSGIRGVFGDGLDPATLVRYAGAFGAWLRQQVGSERRPVVVVGRDGRVTGEVCSRIVTATLQATGCDVIDGGQATTPSVAMGVLKHDADGAVILSASHNPAEWNALKLLDANGEFLGPDEGAAVLALAVGPDPTVGIDRLGSYRSDDLLPYHIHAVLDLPYIDVEAIRQRGFRVVVDGINSVGAFAIPAMLEALGVSDVEVLNADVTGRFAHNPEPLPAHLSEITSRVAETGADLGIVVDPDAARLAFVENGGRFFGEELTQVIAADFLLAKTPGPVGTNLSSSRAIEHIARKHGQDVVRSPVGESHVVRAMQAAGAVSGGEGNGGVILPDVHYGRDALVGVALVLQHLAETGLSLRDIRDGYPTYAIAKHKLSLTGDLDADALLASLADRYVDADGVHVSTVDGAKVELDEGRAHVRKSNTEPILRVYTEAPTPAEADALAERFKAELLDG